MTASRYDVIVLSPHLDDGPLSCGALLDRLVKSGGKGLIATVFTADMPESGPTPFAKQVVHYMNLNVSDAMARRRAEDAAACSQLGVDWLHFTESEAICRRLDRARQPYPYAETSALFGEPDPDDARAISGALEAVLRSLPPAKKWLVPLGIGGHVDHCLLRLAAERFLGKAGDSATRLTASSTGPELLYYEDFPYALKLKNRLRVLGLPGMRRLKSKSVAVSDANLEAKILAIAAYTSQLKPLFGSRDALVRKVEGYVRKVGGERLWSQP